MVRKSRQKYKDRINRIVSCIGLDLRGYLVTIIQSSRVVYLFGISGPFRYAAGASIQVLLIAIVTIQLK